MSRIEDDREAARVAAKQAEAKLKAELRAKEQVAADSAFSRLVQGQQVQARQTKAQQTGRDAIAALLEESEAESHALEADEAAHADQRGTTARLGTRAAAQKAALSTREGGERGIEAKLKSDRDGADSNQGHQRQQAGAERGASGRKADARTQKDQQAERKDSAERSESARAQRGKGELKTDADGGKGSGQRQGGKDGDGAQLPPSFRFNPALMAPVPVAQKNETTASDRLRRIASEIAQKIVERVRVGTNALGNAEFQIDLRQDFMGGMSVKVSAKNGRISAVFSGSDKNVLKMLEEQAQTLKGALEQRGLSLEELRVEARG